MNRKDVRYLSFIPIPVLVVIILLLYLFVKPALFYEPTWLLPVMNTVFVSIVSFIVAYIAMRNYKATGRIQILLLGCGVLGFGIGGMIAGFLRDVPEAGANLNVTIYNTGALIGAVFHFAAAVVLLTGISPEVGSERKKAWLVFSYVGVAIFMALFTMASLGGVIPLFFIQGIGPTPLRQWILGSADILFAFSFLIFIGSYLKSKEVFLYWYSSALALTCINLTASFIQSAVGSPIGWTGRFSQYIGGIYFLIAIVTAMRSAQVRRISFDNVLTASLSPAEEKFRALAEHSPDSIERFDREMKYIYLNQATLRLYGKPAGSIIGKTIDEVGLPGPHVSLLKERIQRVFETAQPTEAEHYVSAKDGTRYYQSRCVPEFGVDGTVVNVLVLSRDLTERKQTEEALRQSEARRQVSEAVEAERHRLYNVLETLPAMICLLTQDYHVPFANKSFREKFGESHGRCCYEYCFGLTAPCGFCETYNVLKTGKPHHWEWTAPDGSVIDAYDFPFTDMDGSPLILEMDIDITAWRRAEEALRESENQVRFFASQYLTAQETERKRIAGELHDSIAASIAAMKFRIENIAEEMKQQGNGPSESLEDVASKMMEINNEVRRIMADLRPSILDDLGIIPAIDWFCREYQKTYSHISVEKQISLSEDEVPDSLKTPIFRISQEAMNNISKYSRASLVNLSLLKGDGKILLTIQDNGQGFDASTVRRGLGLSTMKERAQLSGGSFDLESAIGKGTIIRASWPF